MRNRQQIDNNSLEAFFAEFGELAGRVPVRRVKPPEPQLNLPELETFMNVFGPCSDEFRKRGSLINVWAVAGLKDNELRNAAVLAWLFDCYQSHGRGSSILQKFLHQIARHHGGVFPLPLRQLGAYSVNTECYPLSSTESRVDVVVDGTEFVAFIEVKIRAAEGKRQIERYLELAKAKAAVRDSGAYCVIFLSPVRNTDSLEGVVMATWNDVAQAIEELVGTPNSFGDHVLLQFAKHVRRF